MADRDRFGGSDRDYAYTDYSGRRGLDVRNPADAARQRQQFQYRDKGRTVVSDTEPAFTDMGRNRNVPFPQITGTPNFRPPYGAPGQPSYGAWMQQIDPYADPYSPKKHPNPRMRGMMGGLGGLQQQANLEDDDILRIRGQYGVDADEAKRIYDDMIYGYDRDVAQSSIDPSDWRILEQIIKAGGNPDDYVQTADVSGIMDKYNQFTDKFGELGVSGEGIEYEKDFDVPWGGTGTIEGQYGDEGYGGALNFRWPADLIFGSLDGNQNAMDTGLGSFDVAELTEDQMNMMGNPLNTPDFGVSKEDLWNRTKGMEDKGFFGWGAQEPTTLEEYDDYYNKLLQGEVGNWVT